MEPIAAHTTWRLNRVHCGYPPCPGGIPSRAVLGPVLVWRWGSLTHREAALKGSWVEIRCADEVVKLAERHLRTLTLTLKGCVSGP